MKFQLVMAMVFTLGGLARSQGLESNAVAVYTVDPELLSRMWGDGIDGVTFLSGRLDGTAGLGGTLFIRDWAGNKEVFHAVKISSSPLGGSRLVILPEGIKLSGNSDVQFVPKGANVGFDLHARHIIFFYDPNCSPELCPSPKEGDVVKKALILSDPNQKKGSVSATHAHSTSTKTIEIESPRQQRLLRPGPQPKLLTGSTSQIGLKCILSGSGVLHSGALALSCYSVVGSAVWDMLGAHHADVLHDFQQMVNGKLYSIRFFPTSTGTTPPQEAAYFRVLEDKNGDGFARIEYFKFKKAVKNRLGLNVDVGYGKLKESSAVYISGDGKISPAS